MKKLTLLFFLTLLPLWAIAQIDGIYYYFNEAANTATVTSGSKKYTGDIVIPESIVYNGNSYAVTSIGGKAFYGCSGLTSITIPNSITSIGEDAFRQCSGPTSVHISDIGAWCEIEFKNYYSNPLNRAHHLFLNDEEVINLVIPNGVKSIGIYAFLGCSGLTSITVPNSVTTIGSSAFSDCSGLESASINCYSIGSWFSRLKSLKKVVFGNSVTSIGNYAFNGCSGLTSVSIPNSVTSIGEYAFQNCSGLTSFNIPNSVTSIGYKAFYGCSSLESITIKSYSIGSWFSGLSQLKEVVMGDSVTSIGSSAFSGCSGLTSITIPNSVKSIGDYAFNGCSGLTSINIPNSVSGIGSYAFYGCSGLTSINIPNSVTSIGSSAFNNTQLSTFIVGTGVLSFGGEVFSTRPIKTIWLTNTPPSGYSAAAGTINYVPNDQYSSMSNKAEYKFLSSMFEVDGVVYVPVSPSERTCDAIDCVYDKSVTEIHVNPTVSYKGIEMSVQTLRPYTFYRNSYLQDVDLNFIGSVKNNTFYGCSNLRNVTIGKSITGIGSYAFSYCNALEKIIFPESVQTIDQYAFSGCISMGSVVIGGRSTIIEQYAFSGCKGMTSVVIGDGSKTIANNVFEGCTHLETVVIGDGNTSIGQSAFYGCTGLASVNIGDGTSSIGQFAFNGCTGLVSVSIGDGTSNIGESAFNGCKSLTSLVLGNGTTSIGGSAFSGCSALPSITIPGSVNSIESNAFKGCTSLKEVIMADRDTQGELKLGSNPLFADCPLDSVYIGRNISYNTGSSYGYSPFYRNTSLRAVVITDKEEEISENEFYGCTNLQSVQIGDGVTTIGNRAFSGCAKLQSFGFGTQVKTIGTEAFSDCTAMTEFVSKATTPPTCGAQALDDVNKWTCKLIVPKGSVEAYQGANQWKDFFFMEEGDVSGSTPVEPSEKKCEKPTISYADGKLTFSCETEDVVFHSDITDTDIRQYEAAEVELSVTYTISVYATRNGYADSDVVTATLCWIDAAPQGEGVETDVTQLQAKTVLIQGRNGVVTIEGAEAGTAVAVYNLSGQMIATASTNDGQTTIATPLRRGDIAIIKIGDRAVKARMQ